MNTLNLTEEIIEISKKLISIPSISSDIASNTKVIKRIVSYFSNLKENSYFIEEVNINNKSSLIIYNKGGKDFDIILSGHVDVAPVESELQYNPIIKEDHKLWGRGAADMKSSVAIMLKLMNNLLKEGYKDKKIALIINTDEEIGGFDGAKWFCDAGYKADIVLCPDGGSLQEIVYAEKGILQIQAKAKGIRAHASKRRLGSSAIDKIINFYNEIKNTLEQQELYSQEKHYWTTTVNMTNFHGGVGACNVIPDKAEGLIDIRFTEKFELESLEDILKSCAKKYDITLKTIVSGDTLYSNPNLEIIQKYLQIAKKHCGERTHLIKEHCACDGRFFSKNGSIVILHQSNRNDIHGINERVDTNDFEKLYNTFYDFITTS